MKKASQGCLLRSCPKKQADNMHTCWEPGKPQTLTTLYRGWLVIAQNPGASSWAGDAHRLLAGQKVQGLLRKRHPEGL